MTNKPCDMRQLVDDFEWADGDQGAVTFDGLDQAILGIAEQHAGAGPVVAYSTKRILACLQKDGLNFEEALEYFGHNIQCFSVGRGTPVIVDDLADLG